jgi:CHAT domain-containing protein
MMTKKIIKICVISIFIFMNNGTFLSASTFEEVEEKSSELVRKGKISAAIDTLLAMRDLEKITFEEYAYLTWQAAHYLEQIGECVRAVEILENLLKLRTKKISFEGIANYEQVLIRNTMTLCERWDKKHLKIFLDKEWLFGSLYRHLYANSLTTYGDQSSADALKADILSNRPESGLYYGRALGETLASNEYQYPVLPISRIGNFLNYTFQFDLYDALTDPLINAYDNGTLSRLHPIVFSFATGHWRAKLWRNDIIYAEEIENIFDKQIKIFDAIPYEGLANYIEVKLILAVESGLDPSFLWNDFKNDKRISAFLLKNLEGFYLLNLMRFKATSNLGIGAMLNSEEGYTVVKSIVSGGAADLDGKLKKEDRIIAIAQGDKSFEAVFSLPLKTVVEKIRGRGKVRLKILRSDQGQDKSLELALNRDFIKISDSEISSLIDFVENDHYGAYYKTIAYSVIHLTFMNKGEWEKSKIYLHKCIEELLTNVNLEISRSYAARHDLNILQRQSIEMIADGLSFYKSTNIMSEKESYNLTQKVIEVLNNSYIPSNILHSSNNPNIYERLHKSSKLLFKSYSEEIKKKIKNIKIGNGPELKPEAEPYDRYWLAAHNIALNYTVATNIAVLSNQKFIRKPLVTDDVNFISKVIGNDSVLFSVASTESDVFQTCYSGGSYFSAVNRNISDSAKDSLKIKIKNLRISVDPSLNKSNLFNYELSNKLYNNLFSLLDKCAQKGKHIYIYLDPNLYNLPINALLTKPSNKLTNKNWFAIKYDYTILPYLGLLEKSFPKRKLNSYLGIGNPNYSGLSSGKKFSVKIDDLLVTRGNSGFSKIDNLPQLPFTENEITESGKLFEKSTFLLGKNATEEQFRRTDYNNYDIIHFATHGLVTGQMDNIKEPGLVLTYPENSINVLNDGYLSSGDIAELNLDGQLVLLSACSTAVDDGASNFIGLSDLSISFLDAGAKNIVVSQWPIVSETSAEFMKEYLLNIKLSENKYSLSNTIQEFVKNKSYAHPKYWAPFIPIGKHWGSSEKYKKRFKVVSTTNFGSDNYQDHFQNKIKFGDTIYVAVESGSFSDNKTTLDSFLLKYDFNGNLKSKYHLENIIDPSILGIHNKNIYLSGFPENTHSNVNEQSEKGFIIGVFDIENNSFKNINEKTLLSGLEGNLLDKYCQDKVCEMTGNFMRGEVIYMLFGSYIQFDAERDSTIGALKRNAAYFLIEYNIESNTSIVYDFSENKLNNIFMNDAIEISMDRNLVANINGKLNVFINIDRWDKEVPLGKFSEHYVFENNKFLLKNVYKNWTFKKYLHAQNVLVGYKYDEMPKSMTHDSYYYNTINSDIAFFSYDINEINLINSLELPNAQGIHEIISLNDKLLILGVTRTDLKGWGFLKSIKGETGSFVGDLVNDLPLDLQDLHGSKDPILLLLDKNFNYLDSEVYVDRIAARIRSIEKIDEEHYMLFNVFGTRSFVTLNKL